MAEERRRGEDRQADDLDAKARRCLGEIFVETDSASKWCVGKGLGEGVPSQSDRQGRVEDTTPDMQGEWRTGMGQRGAILLDIRPGHSWGAWGRR